MFNLVCNTYSYFKATLINLVAINKNLNYICLNYIRISWRFVPTLDEKRVKNGDLSCMVVAVATTPGSFALMNE